MTARAPSSLSDWRRRSRGDERFALVRGERLGFYRNFERALAMAPDCDYVALCDQDDRWRSDKLERLLAGIGGAELVYSDARIVRPDGTVVEPSYWSVRSQPHNLASLLLANSITGAATLFRRELLDDALPFPPPTTRPFTITGWRWWHSRGGRSPTSTSLSTTTSSTTTR